MPSTHHCIVIDCDIEVDDENMICPNHAWCPGCDIEIFGIEWCTNCWLDRHGFESPNVSPGICWDCGVQMPSPEDETCYKCSAARTIQIWWRK
jgi:hypothetical protein